MYEAILGAGHIHYELKPDPHALEQIVLQDFVHRLVSLNMILEESLLAWKSSTAEKMETVELIT